MIGESPAPEVLRAELRAWLTARWTGPPPGAAGGRAWMAALAAAGYLGVDWPVRYGGRGLDGARALVVAEELGRAGAFPALGVIGLGMVGPTLLAAGTEAQRRRFMPPLLRGDEVWCQGFSEPGAGSDLAAVTTRAERRGDAYVVDGQKTWTTHAMSADRCLLLARTARGARRHDGLTMLLLDMRAPGVEVRPIRQLTGDAEFGEVFLTGVRVPRDCVVGTEDDGWRVAVTTLLHERGTLGVVLAAGLEREVARLADVVRRRRPADAALRDLLAREWIELQALRLTNRRALAGLEATGVPGPEGSVIKLRWSEANQRLAAIALEALGPEGAVTGPEGPEGGAWARARLRTRANTIEAGTSEVLRAIVAERVLGLPRSR